MNNQMLPIGKLFDIEKGALQSTKCTPGDYDFITAAEEWKTHNEYTHECEALIFAAAASGSLGRTHYVDGKFTTSDLCYILTPKNDEKYPLNLSFYHFVFNSLRPSLVAATKSGTSKESINQTNFKNYEIPYFDIELQDFWIEKLKNTLGLKGLLGSELTRQQALLKKLRQQILQEAIEGKLTAEWRAQNPDVEPASELLKRIAAEKAQLVKDKKVKAQKPLPLITDKEKPFELPPGWEWCRLGDISINSLGKMLDQQKNKGVKKPYLRNLNVQWHRVNISDLKEMPFEEHETNKYSVVQGDVLICEGGYPGQAAIWEFDWDIMFQKALHRVRFISSCFNSGLFVHLLWLWDANREIEKHFTGAGIKHLTGKSLNKIPLPLPPMQEQQAIVTKVEKLLALCDQLETKLSQNQTHAEQVMQAVLKEAFSHNSGIESAKRKVC